MGDNIIPDGRNGKQHQRDRHSVYYIDSGRSFLHDTGLPAVSKKKMIKIGEIIAHLIGLPSMGWVLLNISFDTWKGWVMLIISGLYGLSFTVIYIIKGVQGIRRENFEHRLRKRQAGFEHSK